MPINSLHPEYKANEDIWQKCQDFYSGEEAVKSKGKAYLPPLSGQSIDKYSAYKERTPFYNAVARTVAAMVGAVFRRAPAITVPNGMEYILKDATGTGMSIYELAICMTTEVMTRGRAGLLVDRPEDGGQAYITLYTAPDIRNWDISSSEPYIVLNDSHLVRDSKDRYELTVEYGYRELTIDADGNYIVRVWREADKRADPQVITVIHPERNGRPLDFLPFTCVSPIGLDFDVDRPPVLDMVNILHKHYMASADYANAVHTVCVPTPYVTGVTKTDDFVLNLGPDTAIVIEEVAAKVGFLEFQGQGVQSVEDYVTKLEGMLAALGARMVEVKNEKTLIETAEGVRTREAVATAVLGSVIASVEAGLEKCLRWIAIWDSLNPEEVSCKLNRELVANHIDANMLTAMVKAVQAGTMSFETFYHQLEEAGQTEPGVSVTEEVQRIVKTRSTLPGLNEVVSTP